jgi:hypothetical protein
MRMLVIIKDYVVFQDNNEIQLSTGKILEKNLVQSAFQQTLGEEFTFQQSNNLQHKSRYTLEIFTDRQ